MDILEYISSGILESYVLGTVSDQERKEVECMSHIYPEIKEELTRLQFTLEKYALENPKAPHPNIKNKLLKSIQQLPNDNDEKIIQMEQPSSGGNKWLYAIMGAAAGITLVISVGYFTLQNKNTEITAIKQEMEKMQDDYETLDANIIALNGLNENLAHELQMFRSPEFKTIFLANVKNSSAGTLGIICWNKNNHQVMIAMENMPELPSNKQMQLWAIVEGKPVSLGVLPNDMNASFKLLDTVVANPAAFAITLENQGGSEQPNLDELMLAGNI